MTNPRFLKQVPLVKISRQDLSRTQQELLELDPSSIATVFGSPGSGKTAALKGKYLQLVSEGILPEEILVITANRESANDLRDELAIALQGATEGPIAKTLTSLAYGILQSRSEAMGIKAPELLSGSQQDRLLANVIASSVSNADVVWPKHITPGIVKLAGFRSELRDLVSVCLEHGLSPEDLLNLGNQHQMPTWVASSKLFNSYTELALKNLGHSFDSASLLRRAADYLREGSRLPKNILRLRHVLVDDAQELTPAETFLLKTIAVREVGLSLLGDPDVSTLGFRAANPKAMTLLAEEIAASRKQKVFLIFLEPTHAVRRPELSAVLARVSSQIESARAGRQRKGLLPPNKLLLDPSNSPALSTRIFSQSADEVAALARSLRERHLYDGVAWHEMAVVARSRQQLETLALQLAAESVPVSIIGKSVALRDEFASRELLELAQISLMDSVIDVEAVKKLLTSSYCGLDVLGLLRLKRQLRKQSESEASGDELLAELFANESSVATISSAEGKKVDRFLKLFFDSKKLSAEPNVTTEALLWKFFEASPLATKWQIEARGISEIAVQANRNLDAILALFAAANRFSERNPDGKPLDFIDDQLSLGLPEDSLALVDFVEHKVALLTPSALIGKRFDTVALPGLIEGVWPNLKPRSSLLGATTLDGLMQERLGEISGTLKSELPNELRMLNKAIGAATEKLLVSATDREDEQISQFINLIHGSIPVTEHKVATQLTLRGLAGTTRRNLALANTQAEARVLALALARLKVANVPGADPESWYGLKALSTLEPLVSEGFEEKVTIRPSQLENYLKCPLHWFISSHGGSGTSFSASLGTLVHEALELTRTGSEEELTRLVESRWNTLEFESDWLEEAGKRKAAQMIANLAGYLRVFEQSGGRVIGSEENFNFELASLRVRGQVDRIEVLPDGNVLIVDLKTTSVSPTDKEMLANPQLALYQMAFAENAFAHLEDLPEQVRLGGAKLLIVGGGKVVEKIQPAPDLETTSQFRKLLDETAAGMSSSVFVARVSSHCQDSRQYGSCQLQLTKAVSYVG